MNLTTRIVVFGGLATLSAVALSQTPIDPVFPKTDDTIQVSCSGDLEVTGQYVVTGPYVMRVLESWNHTAIYERRGVQNLAGEMTVRGWLKDGNAIDYSFAIDEGWLQDESIINAENPGTNWLINYKDFVLRRGQTSWVRLQGPEIYWLNCSFTF